MKEFQHKVVGTTFTVGKSDLDEPVRIRGPIWRDILVGMGLAKPKFGMTVREQMQVIQKLQADISLSIAKMRNLP
jgi:hypothetical protein